MNILKIFVASEAFYVFYGKFMHYVTYLLEMKINVSIITVQRLHYSHCTVHCLTDWLTGGMVVAIRASSLLILPSYPTLTITYNNYYQHHYQPYQPP